MTKAVVLITSVVCLLVPPLPTPTLAWAQDAWYLLLPPTTREGGFDVSKPLREWKQVGAFDSALACERDRQRTREELEEMANSLRGKDSELASRANVWLFFARCVHVSDPRLR